MCVMYSSAHPTRYNSKLHIFKMFLQVHVCYLFYSPEQLSKGLVMLVDGRKSGQIQVTKTILEKIAVRDTYAYTCMYPTTHTQAFI